MIGIVALIFLGPRKLPEIARKMGKIMADFRNTTNDFKQTWEREVNFEEETKALRDLDAEPTAPSVPPSIHSAGISAPAIKEIDTSTFIDASNTNDVNNAGEIVDDAELAETNSSEEDMSLSDKKNWL